MFEQMFEKRLVGTIGVKVVDDTEDFTIPVVYIPPPPPVEGKAVITNVEAPSEFTPGVYFYIKVTVRNDGGDDTLFAQIIDRDTGALVKGFTMEIESGTSKVFNIGMSLLQTTDFHGRAKAGHEA